MTTVGVIQARTGSTRLPNKVLARLRSASLFETVFRRASRARIDQWWLATTDAAEDDGLAELARNLGMSVYRGQNFDVLSRFEAIAGETNAAWILRVTADNPYTDSHVIDFLMESVRRASPLVEYCGEFPPRRFPFGYVPELIRSDALESARARISIEEKFHYSHVTSFTRQTGHVISPTFGDEWPRRPDWRWTVDTRLDLEAAREAFGLFGEDEFSIDYRQMVAALDRRADIVKINASVQQKAIEEE
jgi:spore coat polysaccharide biosynthesis protein SpsF (cytidylyltransferase family)|tara:strand:- start:672 stop:1415 length:744 start_codon:yes stop_codon:yes gene_type:complete